MPNDCPSDWIGSARSAVSNHLPPYPHTGLDGYLDDCGVKHFSAHEILRARRVGVTSDPPHRDWWPRIIPTLLVAEAIRAELGVPLAVGNGYRPPAVNRAAGGASSSQHLYFRALDLDLVGDARRDRGIQEAFYRAAGAIYLDHGRELRMGLGLYRSWGGTRVHIDCGGPSWRRPAAWERKYVRPLLASLR